MLISTEAAAVKVRFKEEGLDKSVRVAYRLEDSLDIEVEERPDGRPLEAKRRCLQLTLSEMKAIAAAAALLEV